MAKKHVLAVLGATLALGAAAFATTAASQQTRPLADDPNNANLTYWYWAEPDAPGANAWLKKEVAAYEKAHPKVKIKIVIQSTDTLTSAFTTVAQTKSGPDIATQWATLPVLTPAWNGWSVPISDYVPASESKNWIGTGENMSAGKLWAMPQYLLGIPFVWNKAMFKKAGLDPNKGPKTWAEFLADAKKLKAAGFTPFGMGNKDGYGGAWFFSLIGKQNLNSIDELKAAMIGKAKFSDPKFSGFFQALADLKSKGYLNSDVASIAFEQGLQLFGQKKVAMSWVTDGNVAAASKALGGSKAMGVGPIPVWGKGKLAKSYDTTQSSSAFITKWSKHPKAAAQFLTFLHSPPALKDWYKATGVFPADKRFPASLVTDPIAKQQLKLDQSAVSVWPENFVPPQVDGNADLAGGELITSGSGSPADAVKLWESELAKWKTQHPDEFKNYQKWVTGG
ncbi:MAG: extracellular solute-binding protein [Actinomycetota bacterium]|nr:extracellular solute-binding protein [Actinomycetota bacterium]